MLRKKINFKLVALFSAFCIIFISLDLFFSYLSSDRYNDKFPQQDNTSEHTESLNAPTVIIDAGHGGEDGGAVGIDGTLEKDLNLSIALELEEILRSQGIKTRLTRDTDILLYDKNSDYQGHKKIQDAAARIAIAEEYKNAVFVSIHMNSFSQSKYSGLQVYYSENSPSSSALAEAVQTLVSQNLQPNNKRKIKPSEGNIYILKKVTLPAILVECGFLSNPEECKALNSPEYRSRLCMILYTAISQYLQNTFEGS